MQRFLAILAFGLSAVVTSGVSDGSMEEFIDRAMPTSGVPGLAYAVVADGEITAVGARGVVRTGGGADVTPDTPFVIGSISKSFTALAVMQLIEANEVDLDAEISQYLEGFSGQPADAVTIRQLLSHTSGFSTLQGNSRAETGAVDTTGKDALERSVDARTDVAPTYGPGERWEYSNLNYEILGRLIEVVSGQEFQAYVTANILEPVGMGHSFVADGEIHAEMATGHTSWFTTKRPIAVHPTDRVTAPQGGIVASATDLARYLQMMMNGQDDVLSADGKALMVRPASPASPTYGFGWYVDSGNGSVWHAGSSPGVETFAQMLPAEQKAAVALVNGGGGVGFAETNELRVGLTATALGLDYDGDGSRLPQKTLLISLVILPIVYLLAMVWAWRHRTAVRNKASGIAGRFSLWFPMLTTLSAAWVILALLPRLFGVPLATLNLFQPDLALVLTATAVTGVLWAVFRLGVAYTGRSRPA